MHDWQRARQILAGEWPQPFPPIYEVGRCTAWDWMLFFEAVHATKTPVVIDTEYHEGGHIWLIGLFNEAAGRVIQLRWMDSSIDSRSKAMFLEYFKGMIEAAPVIMHNALADVRAMRKTWGIDWIDFLRIDDTMQAHAVLYVEYDHDLGFLDSCYGKHNRVKHLFKENPTLYNAGDCWAPAYAMAGLRKELDKDKLSAGVYADRLAMLPIIDESMTRGIRINKEAVKDGIEKYKARCEAATAVGQAYCGYPINLSSNDQVAFWLYSVEGLPVQKKRGKRGEKGVEVSVNKDAVGKLREGFLGFEPQEEPAETRLAERITLGGHPLLEARFVNQAARQNLSHYLLPLVGPDGTVKDRVYHNISIHSQNNARFSYTDPPLAQTPDDLRYIYEPDDDWPWLCWDMEQIELRLVAAMARDWPLLDAFAAGEELHSMTACAVWGWQTLEDRLAYCKRMQSVREEFPDISLPGKSGLILQSLVQEFKAGMDSAIQKWLTEVPAAKEEWSARVRAQAGNEAWPGRGCTSLQWKSERQSARELASYDQSRACAVACAAWVACGGPPPLWEGKEDKLRIFAKNFQYRSCFELDASPESAMSMPAAKALGLTIDDMRRATLYWRAAHPTIVAWQRRLIEEGKAGRMTRDWHGTLRRYTDHLDNIASQILDHPSQSGCQSIMTLILLELKRKFKDAIYFVYGLHDSANVAIWRPRWNEIAPQLRMIIEQKRNIFGLEIPFPASFKSRGIKIDEHTLMAE